ncbi:MAG: tetratricopeptide repeat protein [Chthoniobacteraceae bacterium]
MSPATSDSNEPKPATPAPRQPQEFDLLAFWIQYRRLIIRLVVVAVLAVSAWGAWLFMDYRRRAGSEDALANAKTAADYRKVSAEWQGTPAAGTALMQLAEDLRKEGKPAEAAQALREFLAKYPLHPLRIPAAHALAASLETAGKYDEALTAYQQFASAHGRSAFAPLAFIGQARVLMALHRTEEAQKVLESVEEKFPGNPFVDDAHTLLDEIKNAAGKKTGGSPRPTPPPASPAPENPKGATPPPAVNLRGMKPAPQPPATPPAPAPKIKGASPAPAPTAPAPKAVTPASPAPVAPPPTAPAPAAPPPAAPAPAAPTPAAPAPTAPTPPAPAPTAPAPAK